MSSAISNHCYQIKSWTNRDPLLLEVQNFVLNRWPYSVSEELQPYFCRQSELSLLMWGSRIIIPHAGHSAALDELHNAHPGKWRIQSLARSYFWWPGIDSDLENKVKSFTMSTPPELISQSSSPSIGMARATMGSSAHWTMFW